MKEEDDSQYILLEAQDSLNQKNYEHCIALCKPVLAKEPDKEGYIKANCLLAQAYVKDPGKNVQDLLNELVAKIGENIRVGRFVRYKVGE